MVFSGLMVLMGAALIFFGWLFGDRFLSPQWLGPFNWLAGMATIALSGYVTPSRERWVRVATPGGMGILLFLAVAVTRTAAPLGWLETGTLLFGTAMLLLAALVYVSHHGDAAGEEGDIDEHVPALQHEWIPSRHQSVIAGLQNGAIGGLLFLIVVAVAGPALPFGGWLFVAASALGAGWLYGILMHEWRSPVTHLLAGGVFGFFLWMTTMVLVLPWGNPMFLQQTTTWSLPWFAAFLFFGASFALYPILLKRRQVLTGTVGWDAEERIAHRGAAAAATIV